MRNYSFLDEHYSKLLEDVYPQPPDIWHTAETKRVIDEFVVPLIQEECTTVLDVGCGQGFAQELFYNVGLNYLGVCLGEDFRVSEESGYNVQEQDFNFLDLDYRPIPIDLIFARHSLEHSPFPILTLMEWHRISKKWLCLILPNPKYWGDAGRNHYSVATFSQASFWLDRSGWSIIRSEQNKFEFVFLCEKQ